MLLCWLYSFLTKAEHPIYIRWATKWPCNLMAILSLESALRRDKKSVLFRVIPTDPTNHRSWGEQPNLEGYKDAGQVLDADVL